MQLLAGMMVAAIARLSRREAAPTVS
jgi:hypothetical protein